LGFSALDYGRLIDRAASKGMAAVVIRVLAAGVLSATPESGGGSSPEALSPGSELEADIERARQLEFLTSGGETLARAAVRFALMKPEVSTVLVGFSNVEQVEEAVSCSGAGPLPEEAMERLRNLWRTDVGHLS
jgi:aryl-alcohol dehydrogenase-like predicted oxidoreductase